MMSADCQSLVQEIMLEKQKEQLMQWVRQYGDGCMAYTTLQPGLEYFMVEDMGFIAYVNFRHWLFAPFRERQVVLANPVCDPANYAEMTRLFLKKFPHSIFLQIDERMGQVLDSMGYQVNSFGIETELPCQNFSLAGKARSKLRQWRNKCRREGVVVEEKEPESCDEQAITTLSEAWLKRRGGHEYQFLTRPFVLKSEPDARFFIARQNDEIIGITVFDPIYRNGEVIAYYHNVDRLAEHAPNGTSVYMVLEALEKFREEGRQYLTLGMSPLYRLGEKFRHDDFTHKALWFTFHKLNFLYPFKGNAYHKKKFAGRLKKVYFSSAKGNSVKELLVTMKALKLF